MLPTVVPGPRPSTYRRGHRNVRNRSAEEQIPLAGRFHRQTPDRPRGRAGKLGRSPRCGPESVVVACRTKAFPGGSCASTDRSRRREASVSVAHHVPPSEITNEWLVKGITAFHAPAGGSGKPSQWHSGSMPDDNLAVVRLGSWPRLASFHRESPTASGETSSALATGRRVSAAAAAASATMKSGMLASAKGS